MKKSLIAIILIIAIVIVCSILNINQRNEYLQEEILNYVMEDYNYLTGNSNEKTKKYFEELKAKDFSDSTEVLKKFEVYGSNPKEVVLKIQTEYSKLIQNITIEEKEELDKYLLKNSLKYYYSVSKSGK